MMAAIETVQRVTISDDTERQHLSVHPPISPSANSMAPVAHVRVTTESSAR